MCTGREGNNGKGEKETLPLVSPRAGGDFSFPQPFVALSLCLWLPFTLVSLAEYLLYHTGRTSTSAPILTSNGEGVAGGHLHSWYKWKEQYKTLKTTTRQWLNKVFKTMWFLIGVAERRRFLLSVFVCWVWSLGTVRDFYGIPEGELSKKLHLYVNIKETFNEQCLGQSPTAICGSSWSGSTWSLQKYITKGFLVYTSTSTKPESNCMGHLGPAMGPCPQHSLVTNHHFWAVATRIFPSALRILQIWGVQTCLLRKGKRKVLCFFTNRHQNNDNQEKTRIES